MDKNSVEYRIECLEHEVKQQRKLIRSSVISGISIAFLVVAITLFLIADGNPLLLDLSLRFTFFSISFGFLYIALA